MKIRVILLIALFFAPSLRANRLHGLVGKQMEMKMMQQMLGGNGGFGNSNNNSSSDSNVKAETVNKEMAEENNKFAQIIKSNAEALSKIPEMKSPPIPNGTADLTIANSMVGDAYKTIDTLEKSGKEESAKYVKSSNELVKLANPIGEQVSDALNRGKDAIKKRDLDQKRPEQVARTIHTKGDGHRH